MSKYNFFPTCTGNYFYNFWPKLCLDWDSDPEYPKGRIRSTASHILLNTARYIFVIKGVIREQIRNLVFRRTLRAVHSAAAAVAVPGPPPPSGPH